MRSFRHIGSDIFILKERMKKMTIKIINEKPRNELLIEDIEWDEEHLKTLSFTKEEALNAYKCGFDYTEAYYISSLTASEGEE